MNTRQVKIQNIIALHEGKGERGKAFVSNKDTVVRLLAYIKSLVDIAKKKHVEALPLETTDELVTRLVLNEFSLYPKYPLTISEYKRLISGLDEMAAELPPNIHLVIATFPVIWTDNKHHNVGLHIQSPRKKGGKPILHHFDKRTPHPNDPTYTYGPSYTTYELYDIEDGDYYADKQHSPHVVLANTAVTSKNQSKGAIRVKTAEGNQFVSAIEICFEHLHDFALVDTISLMASLKAKGKPVPERGTHVVSSHTILLEKERLVASPTHADTANYKKKKAINLPTPKLKFGDETKVFAYPPKTIKKFKNIDVDAIKPASSLPAPSNGSGFFPRISTAMDKLTRIFALRSSDITKSEINISSNNTNEKESLSSRAHFEVVLGENFDFKENFDLYGSSIEEIAQSKGSQVNQNKGLGFFSPQTVAAIKIKQVSNDALLRPHSKREDELMDRPSSSSTA